MFGERQNDVDVKKVALYILLVFILHTIIIAPKHATELVGIGFEGISNAAKGVGQFMTELVN